MDRVSGLIRERTAHMDRLTADLPFRDGSPSEARALLRTFLAGQGIDGQVCDRAALVASELVMNAVMHGSEPIGFCVELQHDVVAIAVTDADERQEPFEPLEPSFDGTQGRGLTIVESVTRRWGFTQHPDDGKTVWGEIAR